MPEPLLYLQSMAASAFVSAMFLLAMTVVRRPPGLIRLNTACAVGMGLGIAVGSRMLSLRSGWPPVNALDRFLTIVVPTVLCIELIAGFLSVPQWIKWFLRISLAMTIPRVLVHGSVYLSGDRDVGPLWHTGVVLACCGALLAVVWGLLSWLSQRSPGVSIPLALCLSIQCAGLTVMLAGYIKGGAVAFPLVATLAAITIGSAPSTKRVAPAILGIGVVELFAVLFIGHFFGRLTAGCALGMMLAPLLCWVTEIPLLRRPQPWLVSTIRLILVAIPLVIVLILAKRDFDRKLRPLLESRADAIIPVADVTDHVSVGKPGCLCQH